MIIKNVIKRNIYQEVHKGADSTNYLLFFTSSFTPSSSIFFSQQSLNSLNHLHSQIIQPYTFHNRKQKIFSTLQLNRPPFANTLLEPTTPSIMTKDIKMQITVKVECIHVLEIFKDAVVSNNHTAVLVLSAHHRKQSHLYHHHHHRNRYHHYCRNQWTGQDRKRRRLMECVN